MAFDSMAGSDQVGLVHVAGRLNRTVELLVHLGRQRIGKRIERIGELADGVELLQAPCWMRSSSLLISLRLPMLISSSIPIF